MLIFEALDARHGDSLILRWGSPQASHTALVDGGPSGTWTRTLRPRLRALAAEEAVPRLALVAVSHVDADHIDGVLRLLHEMRDAHAAQSEPPWKVDRLWHNALGDIVTGGTAATGYLAAQIRAELASNRAAGAIGQSAAQGREVHDLARFLGLSGNAPLGGIVASGSHTVVEGMSVVVLGPRRPQLAAQWAKWQTAIGRSDARAAAAAYTDPNVYNHASIILLLTYGGATLLLTGDARGDHIVAGLAEAGRLHDGRIHVTLLKVPHHGSAASTTPEFFEAVTADHYVISACGRHGHPHREVLDWIVRSRRGESFTIHLTNAIAESSDALAFLGERGAADRFDVRVRADNQPGVRIALIDEAGSLP